MSFLEVPLRHPCWWHHQVSRNGYDPDCVFIVADDSDASSVCSISTCPGDLGYATKATCRPKMPTFEESDQGFVSDVPKSSTSPSSKAKGKSPNKETSGIRPRPPGIYTAYRLCKYSDRPELCWQGKLCTYAHSEAERKAWEDDFKKSKYLQSIFFSLLEFSWKSLDNQRFIG